MELTFPCTSPPPPLRSVNFRYLSQLFYIYIYTHTHTHTHTYMCVCLCLLVCVGVCVCVFVCVCVCSPKAVRLNLPDVIMSHTYLLIPWSMVILEKLASLQLVKKFPAFYGTRRFLTALTSARHLSLSWTSPIQSSYSNPTSLRSILTLSSHLRLGLPSGLFPSGFPTSILYTHFPSPVRATW